VNHIQILITHLLLLLVLLVIIPAKLLLIPKLHVQPPPTFWRIHILIPILLLFSTRTSSNFTTTLLQSYHQLDLTLARGDGPTIGHQFQERGLDPIRMSPINKRPTYLRVLESKYTFPF
jgi:hypothetical protein